jgi:succinate-semialdehyde dehydrogenase/glutarate-semialdehyde dehydrogenase
MVLESRNPATGEVAETFPELDGDQIDRALQKAQSAWHSWRSCSFAERGERLRRAGALLRERKHEYGSLMAREMGKPITEGEAEAEKCAWVCEYYAENAESQLAPERIATDAAKSYVRFDPLGPILAVMPWNFPFWQVFRFAAPSLMAGNVGLLKHASNVPRCSLAIEELLLEAGFPAGVFQSLLISSPGVEKVLSSPIVKAATLTGSEKAGIAIASLAGRLLKKTVLELGGSDPFLVLDDVDVPHVAGWAARARTVNSGQSCIAAKRFLVQESIADRFVEAFRTELERLPVGDPMDAGTRVGPLARDDLRRDLHAQVTRSVELGATLVTGGKALDRPGYYYAPTLLDHVGQGMPAFEEETFGPVAAVIRIASAEEGVRLANASPYGLGASIWSGDPERAELLAPYLESGCVFINGMVKSDPRLPFGGVKLSGYGRELASYGIKEFVNIKSVWVGA